ncbi:flavin monoamine oxidase family protein [Sphingomonas aracearum]|uniref:Tryptophan 2-monooxygenase n=1 Tax=Sphingomonas aracearum TaxID=2283317 RepID=A0A369VUA9_9SPHN|nr:NAD(P)/FAD-dependent oxidoreductase [Sphingomonas aracearum]RDE05235.1 FAD-dependent oxidoreductase [Sphingomonas aracearum]
MTAGADAVVIGGGAAGIAAARTLQDAGRDVLLIEARDHLGGRALSFAAGAGMTLDLGCGWLHSARRNPWAGLAERYGFTVDRSSPNWGVQWQHLGFPPGEQEAFGKAWESWERRVRAGVAAGDQPLSAFLPREDRWYPYLDAISGYANGAPLDAVSAVDWLAYEDASTEDNWALREGYGTLVARHAEGLAVRLGCVAERIDHSRRLVRVETSAGPLETRAVICALPTPAYARLAFHPALPDKHAAAADLPLGLADKVFLAVDGPLPWPAHSHLAGNPHSAVTFSHRLSPFGWPVIESFIGGTGAEEAQSGEAAAALAIDELVALLGSDWRARLRPIRATRWRHEAYIHGSYSHARIGAHGQRRVLAEAVDGRLFFAGEACHESDFSTAHGAFETGVTAAEAVLSAI